MKQLSVELQDRRLRFDGVSVIHPDRLAAALLLGVHPPQLRLTELSEEVQLFNDNAPEQLLEDTLEPVTLDFSWKLPETHLNMDLVATIVARAVDRLKTLNYSPALHAAACERIQAEVDEIQLRGMVEFFKTIIYILDTFQQKGVVWGVGRGSSCASYVLFILGLHSVDCVRYNVPMEEFFHE